MTIWQYFVDYAMHDTYMGHSPLQQQYLWEHRSDSGQIVRVNRTKIFFIFIEQQVCKEPGQILFGNIGNAAVLLSLEYCTHL